MQSRSSHTKCPSLLSANVCKNVCPSHYSNSFNTAFDINAVSYLRLLPMVFVGAIYYRQLQIKAATTESKGC